MSPSIIPIVLGCSAVALGCIMLLTYANSRNVRIGKMLQSSFTLITVITLAGVCLLSLTIGWKGGAAGSNFAAGAAWVPAGKLTEVLPGITAATSRLGMLAAFLLSQRGAYFAYDRPVLSAWVVWWNLRRGAYLAGPTSR